MSSLLPRVDAGVLHGLKRVVRLSTPIRPVLDTVSPQIAAPPGSNKKQPHTAVTQDEGIVTSQAHPFACSSSPNDSKPRAFNSIRAAGALRRDSPRWPICSVVDAPRLHTTQFIRNFFGGGLPFASTPEACEHRERRLVRYCPEQVFHVVSSVQDYPHFLPWCKSAEIKSSKGNEDHSVIRAEMSVGFRGLSESYISEVTLQKPHKIIVTAFDSTLFQEMSSEWQFSSGPTEESCWLDFRVRFRFSNHLYNQVASVFQDEVAKTMISSFEERCKKLYGPPLRPAHPSRPAPAT